MRRYFILFCCFIFLTTNFRASEIHFPSLKFNQINNKLPLVLKKDKDEMDLGIKGKIILTGGVGLNFFRANLYICYVKSSFFLDSIGGFYSLKTSAGPMTNVMIDYGIGKQVSVGLAFGYQTYRAVWAADNYYLSSYSYPYYSESFTDKWMRMHFAIRGDYHIIAKENICLYTGLKIGYNTYKMTSSTFTKYDNNYIKNADVVPSPISVQAHFGFSYFFADAIGINAEIGIGYAGPYLFALGITGKF